LVSLHDVTPAHRSRLDRAEDLLTRAQIGRVAYLLVPDFHGRHRAAVDPEFREWCRRDRPFEVEWVLHGYSHVEDSVAACSHGLRKRLARRFMTAGEGEFLALDARQQRERLAAGRQALADIVGVRPRAFVAPAWLFNDALLPELAALGFRYTEHHTAVIDVVRRVSRRCPVITWATRTVLRRVGSRCVCPTAFALFRRQPAIRLAIHPFDMDHPRTVDQIRGMIDTALQHRSAARYDDLFLR
jgi:uncharacterized protein